jgi:hypothetical protein
MKKKNRRENKVNFHSELIIHLSFFQHTQSYGENFSPLMGNGFFCSFIVDVGIFFWESFVLLEFFFWVEFDGLFLGIFWESLRWILMGFPVNFT